MCTHFNAQDEYDYKKLSITMKYRCHTQAMQLTLEASDMSVIEFCVDTSFALHPKVRSDTGDVMTIGLDRVYGVSTPQNKSSIQRAQWKWSIEPTWCITTDKLDPDRDMKALSPLSAKINKVLCYRKIMFIPPAASAPITCYSFVRIASGDFTMTYRPTGEMWKNQAIMRNGF